MMIIIIIITIIIIINNNNIIIIIIDNETYTSVKRPVERARGQTAGLGFRV